MTGYADLEIGLHRRDAENYGVELRFLHPEGNANIRLIGAAPTLVQFDLDRLREVAADADAYGKMLTDGLFANSAVREAFLQARSSAQALDLSLRLSIFIAPSVPELHGLCWETLCDPQDGSHLVIGEHLLFSRYLSSLDWRPAGLQPRADLTALMVETNFYAACDASHLEIEID